MDPGPVAVVVAVGDELLSGRTVDSNSAWLGGVLASVGVPVVRRYTVGDDPVEIGDAVSRGLARAEMVVVTGGLGPTHDDRTLESVAGLLQRPLRIDQGLVDSMEARFLARGFPALPPANLRQARVPEGAAVLPNRRGTAPGIQLDLPDRRLVLLPGVPGEMKGMMEEQVLPGLQALFGHRLRPVRSASVLTTGIAESALAGLVEPLLPSSDFPGVDLAFLPGTTGVELRLSAREGAIRDAGGDLERARKTVEELVARWMYRGPDLAHDLAAALLQREYSVATAESCTGGLLGKRLTDLPGSSRWYVGGVVAYADEVKRDLLGVDAGLLRDEGAVSGAVASAMAEGAMRRLRASTGIGITGVAGPGGGSEEKPVGTVWIGVAVGDRSAATLHRFPGDREDIRDRSAQAAIQHLLRMLGES